MEKLWIRLLLGVCLLLHNVGGSDMLSGPQDLLNIANEKVDGGSDKFSVKHGTSHHHILCFILKFCADMFCANCSISTDVWHVFVALL